MISRRGFFGVLAAAVVAPLVLSASDQETHWEVEALDTSRVDVWERDSEFGELSYKGARLVTNEHANSMYFFSNANIKMEYVPMR